MGYAAKKCDYCKRDTSHRNSNDLPHIGNSIFMSSNKYFCSSDCLRAYKSENNNSGGSSNSDKGGGGIIGGIFKEEEKSAEQIRAEAEERRIREQEEREALERDRAKAKVLKGEGKKWLAMWYSIGQKGRIGIGAGVVIALFAGGGAIKGGNLGMGVVLLLVGAVGLAFAVMIIKDALK